MTTEWTDDYENNTTTPNDGKGSIEIWWEDMRRQEVRKLIKEVYERGKRSAVNKLKKKAIGLEGPAIWTDPEPPKDYTYIPIGVKALKDWMKKIKKDEKA